MDGERQERLTASSRDGAQRERLTPAAPLHCVLLLGKPPSLPTTTKLLFRSASPACRLVCSARLASLRRTAAAFALPPRSHFHAGQTTHKRRFDKLPELEMDVQALTQRIAALGVNSSSSAGGEATALSTYFFTPKSGSKHPDNAEQDLKLVVVALEESKNVGPAKVLAASVGLKDMRAVSGADLEKLLGRTRDQGE